jgi:hypothetical protein
MTRNKQLILAIRAQEEARLDRPSWTSTSDGLGSLGPWKVRETIGRGCLAPARSWPILKPADWPWAPSSVAECPRSGELDLSSRSGGNTVARSLRVRKFASAYLWSGLVTRMHLSRTMSAVMNQPMLLQLLQETDTQANMVSGIGRTSNWAPISGFVDRYCHFFALGKGGEPSVPHCSTHKLPSTAFGKGRSFRTR